MTARTRVQVLLLAAFTSVAGLMATRQLVAAGPTQATATAQPDACRSGNRHGQTDQRPALLRPRQPQARQACGAPAGRAGRIGPRGRRPAGARALRRAHGVQRHAALPEAGHHLVHRVAGMRFGADLNAYTSFDKTVYMLQVPTDKPETIDRALLVLEDWAQPGKSLFRRLVTRPFSPSSRRRQRIVVCAGKPTARRRSISDFGSSTKARSTRTLSGTASSDSAWVPARTPPPT